MKDELAIVAQRSRQPSVSRVERGKRYLHIPIAPLQSHSLTLCPSITAPASLARLPLTSSSSSYARSLEINVQQLKQGKRIIRT